MDELSSGQLNSDNTRLYANDVMSVAATAAVTTSDDIYEYPSYPARGSSYVPRSVSTLANMSSIVQDVPPGGDDDILNEEELKKITEYLKCA